MNDNIIDKSSDVTDNNNDEISDEIDNKICCSQEEDIGTSAVEDSETGKTDRTFDLKKMVEDLLQRTAELKEGTPLTDPIVDRLLTDAALLQLDAYARPDFIARLKQATKHSLADLKKALKQKEREHSNQPAGSESLKDMIKWLNDRYYIVQDYGGKSVVKRVDGTGGLFTQDNFATAMRHLFVVEPDGNGDLKKRDAAVYWLSDPKI